LPSPRLDVEPAEAPGKGLEPPPATARTSGWRKAFRLNGRDERLLFLAGLDLMLLSFLLVQQATNAFAHREIAVMVVSLSYFAGVSLGYFVSHRVTPAWVQRLMPVFLVSQMALLIGVQALHQVVRRAVGDAARALELPRDLGAVAAGTVVAVWLACGATALYAVFLPIAVDGSRTGLRRAYSVEVSGSIVALAALPVLAAVSRTLVVALYFLAFLGIAAALGRGRVWLWSMAALVVAFLAVHSRLDAAVSAWYYAREYGWKVKGVPLIQYTSYHKIEVLDVGSVRALCLNGKRQFLGGPRRAYSYFVAEYPARLLGAPTVCVLGCGSMATVGRIGGLSPRVRIVDIDPGVFEASRVFFREYNRLDELHNWSFVADDAKHFVATTDERFDLVLHDIPPARNRQTALTYTDEFFRLVKARLTPGGVFSISSLTPLGGSEYGRRMIATLASVFDRYFVLVDDDSVYFYGGGPGLQEPEASTLTAALDPGYAQGVRALSRAETDALVAGARVITTGNVGDLIYE
jgi:spermidine synthase